MSASPAQTVQGQDEVKYVRLGKSGLKISLPVVGCMGYGSDQWMVSSTSDVRLTSDTKLTLRYSRGLLMKTRYGFTMSSRS